MTSRLPIFAGTLIVGLGAVYAGGAVYAIVVSAAWLWTIAEVSIAASRALDLPVRKYMWVDAGFSALLAWTFLRMGPAAFAASVMGWFLTLIALYPPTRAGLSRWMFSTVVNPYVTVGAASFYFLRRHGWEWPALAIGIVAAADTVAYLAGRAFGRRLLAPSISPSKTWEGAVAGVIAASALAAPVLSRLAGCPSGRAIAASAVLAVMAVCGDLFESFLKRGLGLKDFGSSLPGHGGLFDRLDSLLAVSIGLIVILAMGGCL